MEPEHDHISVCICTYQRPQMLLYLLRRLRFQESDGLFEYSIVVVDNDHQKSAQSTVDSFRNESGMSISYDCEPEQNIALARNKAVRNSRGNYLALIDDDEFPDDNWLLNAYQACGKYRVDGVLGPVRPRFERAPPRWVVEGGFYSKDGHKTGDILEWRDTRTSNVMIRRSVFTGPDCMFRKELGRGGEDKDFFKRAIDRKHVFAWSNEACVLETIPVERCSRSFMVKRALLRGKSSLNYPDFDWTYIAKSVVAIPAYALLLPVALLMGHHNFMRIVISLFEHLGRILGLLGVDVIKQYYVSK